MPGDCQIGEIGEPREEVADGKGPELGEGFVIYLEAKRLRLEAFATAGVAGGVGTVAAEEDADVHLVGAGFHPVEEALDAIPSAGLPRVIEFLRSEVVGLAVAVVNPFLFGFRMRSSNAHLMSMRRSLQFLTRSRWHSSPRSPWNGFTAPWAMERGFVGDRFFEVDADDAAEAAALGTGSERGVEGEEGGGGRAQGEAGNGLDPR